MSHRSWDLSWGHCSVVLSTVGLFHNQDCVDLLSAALELGGTGGPLSDPRAFVLLGFLGVPEHVFLHKNSRVVPPWSWSA